MDAHTHTHTYTQARTHTRTHTNTHSATKAPVLQNTKVKFLHTHQTRTRYQKPYSLARPHTRLKLVLAISTYLESC